MHKPKPKDEAIAPRPSFMSSKQMSDYLQDLRSNRIQRPNGSRPPPVKFGSISGRSTRFVETPAISPLSHPTFEEAGVDTNVLPERCTSAQSHRRTNSAISKISMEEATVGRPLVRPPQSRKVSASSTGSDRSTSMTYRENGHRMVEKEEARALRLAMEELDIQKEQGLYTAARDEAAELVYKHQNPEASNPEAPYAYPGSRHQRSQSLGRAEQDLQRSNSKLRKRGSYNNVSGGSRSSSLNSMRSASSSSQSRDEIVEQIIERGRQPREASGNPPTISGVPDFKHRRRSSGSKRKTSGSVFRNPDDQIYEEPEEETSIPSVVAPPKAPTSVPLQVRRNPFSRVQFAKEGLVRANTDPSIGLKKFDRFEIHRNPPSQSRNAAYTSNTPTPPTSRPTSKDKPDTEDTSDVKLKDGKEIRGDDIRKATSMRLSDRSPKLPTPTMVSDSPGRPIVSFKNDWKPKEVELKQEVSIASATPRPLRPFQHRPLTKSATEPVVPQIHIQEDKPLGVSNRSAPAIPRNNSTPAPPIPSISVNAPPPRISISQAPPVPSISVNAPPPPSISISEAPLSRPAAAGNPPIPTISVQETPSISANSRPIPTINAPSISVSAPPVPPISEPSARPLPTPRASGKGPFSRPSVGSSTNARPHWTPSNSHRSTALCAQCALPIAGRIVSAAGSRFHPECFVCHHCGEGLECVAFYPEPENKREERVDRIRRRINGEDVEIVEGMSEIDDGDESMRFYCHLDFHEMFSPRCKSCKTPIEGEVVVACGAEWHVGHFFCAQCGDPFDSKTPFVEKDGYAWCVGCHTNRYSTKCKKCRKPVTDTVVKALGAEWHTQCFCCMECNGSFDDGRYFLRGDSEDPVCVKCEEKRLKA